MKSFKLKPTKLPNCPFMLGEHRHVNAGSLWCTDKCTHCKDIDYEFDIRGNVEFIIFNCNFEEDLINLRSEGYYWIRISGKWIIGYWDGSIFSTYVNRPTIWTEHEIQEVDENNKIIKE